MFSCIYTGKVIHHRLLPHKHRFSYRLFMVSLDLQELPTLFDRFKYWAYEKTAIATFRRKDHYGEAGESLYQSISKLVEQETGNRPVGSITLVTHLRYFGYIMNPVSFYFCWDKERTYIKTIVAEVHNTPWGEQHCYVLNGDIHPGANRKFEFDKAFHVSPFMDMQQQYCWSFNCPGDEIHIAMQSFENTERKFIATMRLQQKEITQQNLNGVLFHYPFMTIKVIAAIYWQALRLWWKKTPFYEYPKHKSRQEAKLENS